MNSTFKHAPLVHLLGIGGSVFFAWLAHRLSVEHFERGGPVFRVVFVAICAAFAVGVLVLYVTSGVNRYEITADGLRVRRLFRTTFHPWREVSRIDLNNPLHYIVIRGRDRVIAYTSTDYFPRIIDLIRAIHERSDCLLPARLTEILASQGTNEVT
jgi:hypothetical protein